MQSFVWLNNDKVILEFNNWIHTAAFSKLNAKQKNDKLIQIIDVNEFINGYNAEKIEMVDCLSSSVNIISIKDKLSGIVFYELDSFLNQTFHKNLASDLLSSTKMEKNLHELWLIFVKDDYNETKTNIKPTELSDFKNLFDQIFLFDFHRSSIEKLV